MSRKPSKPLSQQESVNQSLKEATRGELIQELCSRGGTWIIASDSMNDNGTPMIHTIGGITQQMGLLKSLSILSEVKENQVYDGFVETPSDEEWETSDDDDDEWEEPEV